MHTLIVESPAKAKTINKYLGKDFKVLASFGHVRDLPSKNGSVRPDEDFAMDYEANPAAKKHMAAIADAAKKSDILYLATDPDREGEAISWHVVEALKKRRALPKKLEVKRVVFYEITKKAVLEAVANPRDIDISMVNAQQARRALDYLVGFNISPILWRKLPGARSAGRVQSVALRLISERDAEIEIFIKKEYWDITSQLQGEKIIKSRLVKYDGEKLEKFSITNEMQANKIADSLRGEAVVNKITPKQIRRNPYAPFSTSTLQMDAARKLRFSAKQTMMLAQKLYEGVIVNGETVGLITYMRTDSIQISFDAIEDVRKNIAKNYGDKYLPEKPRIYKTKAKNAQEAHEAIRPTGFNRTPEQMRQILDDDLYKLYELIYKRTVASQMTAAIYDQLAIDFKCLSTNSKNAILRANGSVIKFDGFLKLYREGLDVGENEDKDELLPSMEVGQKLSISEISPNQHFTDPPARYSEATLVKRLEELGIGRPSTYASIISVLQDRGYVKLENRRFITEMRGRLVNAFLENFFHKYVEYDFTADLEDRLDKISDGKLEWKQVLADFWQPFNEAVNNTKEVPPRDVLEKLDEDLTRFIYGKQDVTDEDKICPKCRDGKLHLKTGKFGAFLGCIKYPDCNYTKQLGEDTEDEELENSQFPIMLGVDGDLEIFIKKGPYGLYVERALAESEKGKPKRASLAKGTLIENITLDSAIGLLSLPRSLGENPETDKKITVGLGRFGAYILHDKKYTSLPKDEDILTIGLDRAIEIMKAAPPKGKGRAKAESLRKIGEHPDLKEEMNIFKGRYGAYIKCGKINASLPKDETIEEISLEKAAKLVSAKKDKK